MAQRSRLGWNGWKAARATVRVLRKHTPAPPAPSPLTSDQKRTGPKGRPGAGGCLVSTNYFFSSSIAALALSAATDDFPALHATSASLTSVEAFWKLGERGDWMS